MCAQINDAKKTLFPEAKILHWFVQMALGLQVSSALSFVHAAVTNGLSLSPRLNNPLWSSLSLCACAPQYMHEERVLHRDLKTQNIFLLGNGRLVLGDLGISKVLDGTMDFAQTCIGTPYYM